MNNTQLIGRLTKEVEVNVTPQDKKVANFTLAVNKYGEGADFIQCVAWEKTAEVLEKYTKKGSQIGVTGRIQTRDYDHKDGYKVYVTEVVVNTVDLLDSKPKEQQYEKKVDKHFPDQPNIDLINSDLPF